VSRGGVSGRITRDSLSRGNDKVLSRGFTVVEILLSSVLLAALGAGVCATLKQALEAEALATTRLSERLRVEGIVEHLAQSLASAVNLPAVPAVAGEGVAPGTFELRSTVFGPSGPEWRRYVLSGKDSEALVKLQVLKLAGTHQIQGEVVSEESEESPWSTVEARTISKRVAVKVWFREDGRDWSESFRGNTGRLTLRVEAQSGGERIVKVIRPPADELLVKKES